MPRTRRRKPAAKPKSFGRKVNQALKGKKLLTSPLPPQFTAAPWNALTIVGVVRNKANKTTVDCFTVNDLILAFQAQTGIKLPTLCLRLQKMHAWEMTNQAFEVAIDEMPDGTQCSSYSDSVTVIACYPGKISYARAGYEWPLTSRMQVKTAAEGTTVIFRTSVQTAGRVLFHINVLWSTGQATLEIDEVKPSAFQVQRIYDTSKQGLTDDNDEAVVVELDQLTI